MAAEQAAVVAQLRASCTASEEERAAASAALRDAEAALRNAQLQRVQQRQRALESANLKVRMRHQA